VLNVTSRKIAEEERAALLVREQAARKHAEEADRLKDEFLATLSHELRTPLTAVLGWSSLMRSGDVLDSDFPNALEIIERNARAQARLIDDLLDVSRIITGNLQLELHRVDLAATVAAVGEAVRPAAQAKEIRLNIDIDENTQVINGDPNRLRQVVWNLVLNAIKFTPRGGKIFVRIDSSDNHVRLKVTDSGEGISAEFLPFVFDRFRQAEGSIARKHGGLGLGLAVARHLVELHGGTITAESEGRGHGATFTVELPVQSASTQETETLAELRGKWRELHSKNDARGNQLQGLRVLVVEDDVDSRILVAMMLKRYGAEVVTASNTTEAIKIFEDQIADVLVSDIGMPDQDGFELIRRIRKLAPELGGQIPAVALTGYATAKDRERAKSEGFQTHLPKPVEPAELVNAIAALTGREAVPVAPK
jgi:CheY-like chemotaxis protein